MRPFIQQRLGNTSTGVEKTPGGPGKLLKIMKHLHGRGEDTNILLKNIDRNPNVVS